MGRLRPRLQGVGIYKILALSRGGLSWSLSSSLILSSPRIPSRYSKEIAHFSFSTSATMSKLLTVIGSTGNQGGSVIDQVLGDPQLSKEYKIRGVTRDPSKPTGEKLKSRGVEVVKVSSSLDACRMRKVLVGIGRCIRQKHSPKRCRGLRCRLCQHNFLGMRNLCPRMLKSPKNRTLPTQSKRPA